MTDRIFQSRARGNFRNSMLGLNNAYFYQLFNSSPGQFQRLLEVREHFFFLMDKVYIVDTLSREMVGTDR